MIPLRSTIAAVAAIATLGVATPVLSASLMTSSAGYTGPVLNTGGLGEPYYEFTAGPVSLPGGITYTAGVSSSVIGIGGYGLNNNGDSAATPILGTNSDSSFITLVFDTAVAMFGGGFNYATFDNRGTPGYDPVIMRAFDENDVLIASFDVGALAPVSTPGGLDQFRFRGIDGQGQLIKKFEFGGSFAILAAESTAVVPEPGTWALMILGFGAAGATLRSRRRAGVTA